jgi:hypothetical protein
MSIWGPGPFENDDAADWLTELDEAPDLGSIEDAVSELADPAHVGYAEVPECCEAVAAAEVLAQLFEASCDTDMLDEVTWSSLTDELLARAKADINRLAAMAVTAVSRVMTETDGSELLQIWQEDKTGLPAWIAAMQALSQRLQAIAARGR